MRRIALLAVAAAVALLASAESSAAKSMELESLTIRGPNLDMPLLLTNDELGRIRSDADPRALAIEGLLSDVQKVAERPEGGLGPRFEVIYEFRTVLSDKRRFFRVREFLYPFADSGRAAFTPKGQTFPLMDDLPKKRVPDGWRYYPPQMVRILQKHGLPHLEPVVMPRDDAPRSSSMPFLTPALLACLALTAYGVIRSRVLRGRGPRPTRQEPGTDRVRKSHARLDERS